MGRGALSGSRDQSGDGTLVPGGVEVERGWLKDKIQGWTESVRILSGVAQNNPQSTYAGLQKSLQQDWAFVQRVVPGGGDAFGPVEVALK